MKIKIVALFSATVAMTACVPPAVRTNVAPLDPSLHLAKTCSDGVKLYSTPDRVGHPYSEVALINSKGKINGSNESDIFLSMREEAAAVGANGILFATVEEPDALTKVAAGVGQVRLPRTGKGTAIYVAADSAQSAAACAHYKPRSWFRRVFWP